MAAASEPLKIAEAPTGTPSAPPLPSAELPSRHEIATYRSCADLNLLQKGMLKTIFELSYLNDETNLITRTNAHSDSFFVSDTPGDPTLFQLIARHDPSKIGLAMTWLTYNRNPSGAVKASWVQAIFTQGDFYAISSDAQRALMAGLKEASPEKNQVLQWILPKERPALLWPTGSTTLPFKERLMFFWPTTSEMSAEQCRLFDTLLGTHPEDVNAIEDFELLQQMASDRVRQLTEDHGQTSLFSRLTPHPPAEALAQTLLTSKTIRPAQQAVIAGALLEHPQLLSDSTRDALCQKYKKPECFSPDGVIYSCEHPFFLASFQANPNRYLLSEGEATLHDFRKRPDHWSLLSALGPESSPDLGKYLIKLMKEFVPGPGGGTPFSESELTAYFEFSKAWLRHLTEAERSTLLPPFIKSFQDFLAAAPDTPKARIAEHVIDLIQSQEFPIYKMCIEALDAVHLPKVLKPRLEGRVHTLEEMIFYLKLMTAKPLKDFDLCQLKIKVNETSVDFSHFWTLHRLASSSGDASEACRKRLGQFIHQVLTDQPIVLPEARDPFYGVASQDRTQLKAFFEAYLTLLKNGQPLLWKDLMFEVKPYVGRLPSCEALNEMETIDWTFLDYEHIEVHLHHPSAWKSDSPGHHNLFALALVADSTLHNGLLKIFSNLLGKAHAGPLDEAFLSSLLVDALTQEPGSEERFTRALYRMRRTVPLSATPTLIETLLTHREFSPDFRGKMFLQRSDLSMSLQGPDPSFYDDLKKPDIITMVRLHQNNLSLPETTSDAFKQIDFEHPLFDIWIQQAPSHWQRVLGSAEIDLRYSWNECTPQAYNKQLHIFWTQYGHLAQQFATTDPLLFARILNVAIRNTHLLFTFDKWRPEYDKVKIRQFFQTAAAKDSDPHNELKMILGKAPDVLKNLFHSLDENQLFEFVKLFLKEGDALQFALRELILILRATSDVERYCLIVQSISRAVQKMPCVCWEFSDLLAQAPFVADNCKDVGRLCECMGLSYLAQERKKVASGWAGGGSAASAKLSFFEAFAPLHQYFSSNTDRFSEKPVSKDLIDRTRHFAKFIIHVFQESSTPFDVEIPGARTLTSIRRTTRYLDCFTALKQWYESSPDKAQFKAFLRDVYLPRLKESNASYYCLVT